MPVRHRSLTTAMRLCAVALATLSVLLATGCASRAIPGSGAGADSFAITGGVHGGQQPISGAHIYLFSAHADGTSTTIASLLSSPAVTDSNGGFTLDPSSYTCQAGDQAFFVAAGGDAGSGVSSTAITLVDLFGPCSNLNNASFVDINELTTAAAAFALAPVYGSGNSMATAPSGGFSVSEFTAVQGSVATSAQLAQLFSNGTSVVSPATGTVAGSAPSQLRQTISTLADVAAACVNSTGPGTYPCQHLFASTQGSQSYAATDTFSALLFVAQRPDMVGLLVGLVPANPPFQPTLSTDPQTWALPVFYSGVTGLNWSPMIQPSRDFHVEVR